MSYLEFLQQQHSAVSEAEAKREREAQEQLQKVAQKQMETLKQDFTDCLRQHHLIPARLTDEFMQAEITAVSATADRPVFVYHPASNITYHWLPRKGEGRAWRAYYMSVTVNGKSEALAANSTNGIHIVMELLNKHGAPRPVPVVIVGRHADHKLPFIFNVVAQRDVTWTGARSVDRDMLNEIVETAEAHSAVILFQNAPSQLVNVLLTYPLRVQAGFILNKNRAPEGQRPQFAFSGILWIGDSTPTEYTAHEQFITMDAANGRWQYDGFTFSVNERGALVADVREDVNVFIVADPGNNEWVVDDDNRLHITKRLLSEVQDYYKALEPVDDEPNEE